VKNNGLALKFASDDLKDNKDIVKFAIYNNIHALKFASKRLQDFYSY